MHVLDCGKCEKVLLTTRGKWNVANRDELFVDLRRRRPLGLLETREAMLNCEEDGLLGCLNQWEATRELRILWTLGLLEATVRNNPDAHDFLIRRCQRRINLQIGIRTRAAAD